MYGKQGEGSIPSNSTFQCICRITAIMSGFHSLAQKMSVRFAPDAPPLNTFSSMVEQLTFNQLVLGSSPRGCTILLVRGEAA